jgi:CBS domain containing-hemolysin-like protein
MPLYLFVIATAIAAVASLFFSTLSYSLRDFSRPRLQERMEAMGTAKLFDSIADNAADLVFLTAIWRLFANILVLVCVLRLFHETHHRLLVQYVLAVVAAGVISLFTSVAVPNAAAKYAAESSIAFFASFLNMLRVGMSPVTKIMHVVDNMFRRATGATESPQPEQIEEDILSVVEEGQKEGVVDSQEREMIESVIQFRSTTVAQVMTSRAEMVALELPADLDEVKRIVAESSHSRIPVYEGSLDHIVGVLYARDLLKYVGLPSEHFDVRPAMKPAFYVPETKPLHDLLRDFRLQKVHMAIVQDEYGGTAGLVTIEDVIEELVGDIADEHEHAEPAMLKRIDDHTWEADARIYIDELNRAVGLTIPDDVGFDTLGGFVSTTMGRIPPTGATFEHEGTKYTILDAEPQKVNRVRIDLAMQPATDTPAVS